MSPGVGSKLVTFRVHALEDIAELRGDVNLSLVDVVSSDEESSLCVGGFELIQYAFSVDVRSIIVCDGDCVWLGAVVDTLSTVGLVAELRTSNVAGAASSWDLVGIAAWAVLKQAVGCFAEVTCS